MKKISALKWVSFAALWVLCVSTLPFACSGPSQPNNNNNSQANQNNTNGQTSAGQAKDLLISKTTYALPSDLVEKQDSFRLGSVARLGTLVGGATGLYRLNNGKLSSLDLEPVVAIAPWRSQFLVIAQSNQLVVWDGELHAIKLDKEMGDVKIVDIAAQRDNTLWVATTKQLWRLVNDKLTVFDKINNIEKLHTFSGSPDVVAQGKDGKLFFFRSEQDGSLRMNNLQSGGPPLEALVPGFNGMLWGISKGKLVVRETQDGQMRWAEFDWSQWGDAKLAEKVGVLQHIVADVQSGRLWLVSDSSVISMYGKEVSIGARPPAIKTIKRLVATTDSTLWISDGVQLHQFTREESLSITYEGQIVPFLKNNCWRCHQKVGPGRPLDSYEVVKKHVNNIIKQVESGAMPPDGKTLVGGDANLFKRWLENKVRK